MDESPNAWCRAQGLTRPILADIKPSTEINVYARLIATLLERGAPMTLEAVAQRFEAVGWAPKDKALRSLKRCRPARAPVYRDGDLYGLDPHDDELGFWGFRLGLRPPRVPPKPKAEPAPLADDSVPLTPEELDEAWRGESLQDLSKRRIVLAVLDAEGHPQAPRDVVASVSRRASHNPVTADSPYVCRGKSPVMALPDGRWTFSPHAEGELPKVRAIVRARIALHRKYPRSTAAELEEATLRLRRERWAAGRRMERLSRALLRAVPADRPLGVALMDQRTDTIETFFPDAYPTLVERLKGFDLIAAEHVRVTLRALGFAPGARRLVDLAPPQKTLTYEGRVFKVTTPKLIDGSCRISRPFGDEKATQRKLAAKARGGLDRLTKDLAHLALYEEYSRLHWCVWLRMGEWAYRLPARWVHHDEVGLFGLKESAVESASQLEIVRVWSAPGDTKWSRAERVEVVELERHERVLVDAQGRRVPEMTIQRARLAGGGRLI